jgi:hypothetical protein
MTADRPSGRQSPFARQFAPRKGLKTPSLPRTPSRLNRVPRPFELAGEHSSFPAALLFMQRLQIGQLITAVSVQRICWMGYDEAELLSYSQLQIS